MVRAPVLLEPFVSHIWMSVGGGADARGLGCCAPDLGSGIGGGATVYTQILNPDISKTW